MRKDYVDGTPDDWHEGNPLFSRNYGNHKKHYFEHKRFIIGGRKYEVRGQRSAGYKDIYRIRRDDGMEVEWTMQKIVEWLKELTVS